MSSNFLLKLRKSERVPENELFVSPADIRHHSVNEILITVTLFDKPTNVRLYTMPSESKQFEVLEVKRLENLEQSIYAIQILAQAKR